MKREWRKKRKKGNKLAASLMITVMLLLGTFTSLAGTGFVFGEKAVSCGQRGTGSLRGAAGTPGEAEASGSEAGPEKRPDAEENEYDDMDSDFLEPATSSVALYAAGVSSLGDIWDGWSGDFSFLSGNTGDGSRKNPYQIRNKDQLKGLSQLAAMGMRGDKAEEITGSYAGSYFKLMNNIDLGGMEWNPIGFYRDSAEFSGDVRHKFCGYFDGNGKTVSNFSVNDGTWPNAGFFGAIEDAAVENLTLRPGKTVTGRNNVGIVAGSAVNSRIYNCAVKGDINAAGTAGGIVGEIEGTGRSDSVIENCTANVTVNVNSGSELYAGGIAGKAAGTSIVDCRVETGDGITARIQGYEAIAGGIAGFQNDTDIYNSFVSGTIGGAGSAAAGGITGKYASGHLKVARFEGSIGQSGSGFAGHRGAFIGCRDSGDYFRYGADVSYLFSDAEEKIAFNVCGSGVSEDNSLYTYDDHVGFCHGGDLFYSLVQSGVTKDITDLYYYEELENGILSIIEDDLGGAAGGEAGYELDHFAANDAGRPVRGYLLSIPRIDTISNGTYYSDAASLNARGSSGYCRTIDKDHRGAVAAGKSVTVSTSPNNTDDAKFQMEGVPTYTKGGVKKDTAYLSGGEYTFTMPAENTEVTAVYKKVAVKVSVLPPVYHFSVLEERTGNRKHPTKTTKVTDNDGKLIATYINGEMEQGTQIQPVNIQAVVDVNNDVADNSVKWSIDDPELILLTKNDDEDGAGYTKKSASVSVNLNAGFFTDTVRKLEEEQAVSAYQYPIPDTIFGAGHPNGGVAILTASTRPAASFEGKPCTGNSKINVTYQIKDKTYVANEEAEIDKAELQFTVTRKLTGNRKNPEETIQMTPPQTLTASFTPDYFDKKDVKWTADDNSLIAVNGENKAASVSVKKDAKWILDIIAADTGVHENDPYSVLNGSGVRAAKVTVTADDMLGNRRTASCPVNIRFVTVDETKVYAEGIVVKPEALSYELVCSKTGKRGNPTVTWTGNEEKQIQAAVLPSQVFNQNYTFTVSDDSLKVEADGTVTVNTDAKWIQEINRSYPYKGTHTVAVSAVSEDGGFKAVCTVVLSYALSDSTYAGSSGGSSGGGGGGSSSGVSPNGSVGPAGTGPSAGTALAGSVTGTWVNTADGLWAFTSAGRTYHDEWAFIHNPYAGKNQSSTDWFRFDSTGHMLTGWFTDADGKTFYLSPAPDGTQGHMVTGWHWIAGADGKERCYYFNPVSDGTRGALLKGVTAPDGNISNENGEWIVNGVVQIRMPEEKQS